jgi:DNA-binding NarL/FixJ family response regulator
VPLPPPVLELDEPQWTSPAVKSAQAATSTKRLARWGMRARLRARAAGQYPTIIGYDGGSTAAYTGPREPSVARVKGTVLLVEDERDTRELLAKAIVRAEWHCVVAEDARSALAQAREAGPIAVVVTDVVLGSDDRAGLRLLTELRAQGVVAPVIIITAYADVDKVKFALNEGAAHLLEKPFRASELVAAIERVRTGGSVRPAAEQVFVRANLTSKERTVALRLLEGLTYGDIAAVEHNSAKTIRQHVSQIYAKCGVASRAELFRLVYVR